VLFAISGLVFLIKNNTQLNEEPSIL